VCEISRLPSSVLCAWLRIKKSFAAARENQWRGYASLLERGCGADCFAIIHSIFCSALALARTRILA